MPLQDLSAYGGWQYSNRGGANYIPPATFFTPMRGSQGVRSAGLPSIFPDMPQLGPLGNMGAQMAGYFLGQMMGIDPRMLQARQHGVLEAEYGQGYLREQQTAMASQQNVRLKMATQMMTSRFQGQNGRAPNDAEKAQISVRARALSNNINWAAKLSPLLGLGGNEAIRELFPEQQILEGMQMMSGASLFPAGGAAAGRFAMNLINQGQGRLPFGIGGRAEIFKSLAARGMLPGTQGQLMSGASGAAVKARVVAYEGLASKLRDVYGQNKSPEQLFTAFDEATGGSMAGIGPQLSGRLVENMRASIFANRLPSDYVSGSAAQGAAMARSMGMIGAIGSEAAIAGIDVGQQVANDRGGRSSYGQRSAEELSGIYTRRILAGRGSAFGMVHGGVMSMLMQKAERMGVNLDKLAGGTPEQQAVNLARAVGAPQSVITQLGNLTRGGADAYKATQFFSPGNAAEIAAQLVQSGLSTSETSARMLLTSSTNAGAGANQRFMRPETFLGLQKEETFADMVMPQLRGVIAETMGKRPGNLDSISAKVHKFLSNPANMQLSDSARSAALAKAMGGGTTATGAASILSAATTILDANPLIATAGGAAAMLSTDATRTRLTMTKRLEADADKLRGEFGANTFTGRLVEDLLSGPTKDKDSIIAKYLGSTAATDTGPMGKGYKAFDKMLAAQRAYESFVLDPKSATSKATTEKALLANIEVARQDIAKWVKENPVAAEEARRQGAKEDKTIQADEVTVNTKELNITSTKSEVKNIKSTTTTSDLGTGGNQWTVDAEGNSYTTDPQGARS